MDDIYSYIKLKLNFILKKTLLSVLILYLVLIFAAIISLKINSFRNTQDYLRRTLDMSHWYLVRDAESQYVLSKTIERISKTYSINVYVTLDKNKYSQEKIARCSYLKGSVFNNTACAFKMIQGSSKNIYIIYYKHSSIVNYYIYYFSFLFISLILVTYILFFKFLNMKSNFSIIEKDESKSRIAFEKVFQGNDLEAQKISDGIKIKNFRLNYELAVSAKMKLSIKERNSEELEKKIHDLNKDISRVIRYPLKNIDDYISFLKNLKGYFFDHNDFLEINLKDFLLDKTRTLDVIGFEVIFHCFDMSFYGNKYHLNKIFTNIFSNIIEHSSIVKKVRIESFIFEDCYQISIKNYGSFIGEENFEKIFMKNYTSKPYNFKTSGSGLYDVKQTLYSLGGGD